MPRLQPDSEQRDAHARAGVFKPLWRPDQSGVPKYQRFATTVLEAIRAGVWNCGERLPAEEELVALTRMSLGTVQRGLRLLADQGLVVRRHGLGSFVAERSLRIAPPVFIEFLNDEGEVLPLYSFVVRREMSGREGPWTKHLKTDARDVMQLDRIFDINGEFRVLSRFYADRVMLGRFWDAPVEELNGANFMSIIEAECKLPITDVSKLMRFAQLGHEICEPLQVPHDTLGLQVVAIGMAARDTCVFYQDLFIPPNQRFLQFPYPHANTAVPAAPRAGWAMR